MSHTDGREMSSKAMLTLSKHIYLIGDFNASVGAEYSTWPTCIGHHDIGKINENGETS